MNKILNLLTLTCLLLPTLAHAHECDDEPQQVVCVFKYHDYQDFNGSRSFEIPSQSLAKFSALKQGCQQCVKRINDLDDSCSFVWCLDSHTGDEVEVGNLIRLIDARCRGERPH